MTNVGQGPTPVVIGDGAVAVGTCKRVEDGVPGIIYLKLPESRAFDTDCSDLYPVGSEPSPDAVLATIYFTTPETIQQSIDMLQGLLDYANKQASTKEEETMSKTIQQRVIEVAADVLCVEEESIKPESNIEDDLGADSLDKVEMIMSLEDEFELEISDETAETFVTVQDAIDFLEKAGAK